MAAAFINGKEVTFEPGMTILQAARSAGIFIPVLCEHPALEIVGACRICLVEIENSPKLQAACSTPIADGMVIYTDSEKVLEARRGVVELMLVRHPLDCFSCSANGACLLQNIAYDLGIESSSYKDESIKREKLPIEDSNPFYIRDLNKCILCGRCIRVCTEHAQYRAIDFQNRGINTMVMPPTGRDLEHSDCKFCGQCIALCPVGALAEKPSLGKGRPWELDTVKTVCPYCGVGCELLVKVNRRTGKIANVTTDHANTKSLTKGRSCVKGRFSWEFQDSPDRLTHPLIKENGVFRKASWDEALDAVAKGLKRNMGSTGFFSSARCTNEDNYLMQRFAREVMGTNNVDHCAHL